MTMSSTSAPPPPASGAPKVDYILARDDKAAQRLNTQYELIQKMLDGMLLHRDINLDKLVRRCRREKRKLRIADVASGTGIWLKDVSANLSETGSKDRKYPGADLHGWDIAHQLDPTTLPSDVSLHTHDLLQPFPEEYLGYYDIVHVRFLSASLRSVDWALAFENIYALVRPGGYLHWEDTSIASLRSNQPSEAIDLLLGAFCKLMVDHAKDMNCVDRLLENYKSHSLLNFTHETYTSANSAFPNVTTGPGCAEAAMVLVKSGGTYESLKTVKDVERWENVMLEEQQSKGLRVELDLCVCLGRKPPKESRGWWRVGGVPVVGRWWGRGRREKGNGEKEKEKEEKEELKELKEEEGK